MPNNFPGTFFNRHEIRYKSGALKTKFSKIFYFLLSITDRAEEINRHMGSVNLLPIDIPEETLEVDGVAFDTSKRDYENLDKEKMAQAVVKMLKKVVDLSNANLIENASGLLAKISRGRVDKTRKKTITWKSLQNTLLNFFYFLNRLWTFHQMF